jgi:cytochrome c-type biogenesis protein CcmH
LVVNNLVVKKILFGLAIVAGLCVSVQAKEAPNSSADPALEARMMVIAEELRCLVCQNETIAASHADLAVDLKNQIRTKLTQGQSQKQILDFMVERYGDFVLYRPPLKTSTVLLWLGPFVLLALAVLTMVLNVRRRRRSSVNAAQGAMSNADIARARQLLADAPESSK